MAFLKAAYGANPHAGVNPNYDNGWGGFQYPGGVPAEKLATLRFPGQLGTVVLVGRKALMPLVATLMAITEKKYGYYFHPGWCWSYSNRPVTGSKTVPSNHSRARAFDFNAPNNPFSYAFKSDIPPAVVRLWEAHGFYWGGRYTGQPTDAMHFEFFDGPGSLAKYLASATLLLKQVIHPSTAAAPTKPKPAPKPALAKITIKGITPRRLQLALCAAGYQVPVDGVIGVSTTAGVRWIQQQGGVAQDLVVGPTTWAVLARIVPKKFPLTGGQVFGTWNKVYQGKSYSAHTRSGDPRWDNDAIRRYIRVIQQCEQERGYAPSLKASPHWADGLYEDATDKATAKAQKALGLTPDGMVGPATYAKLFI